MRADIKGFVWNYAEGSWSSFKSFDIMIVPETWIKKEKEGVE